jgi:hypothetical protein
MGWVSAEEYGSALPGPPAEAAPGIIQHINADHADALVRSPAGLLARPTTKPL